MGAHTKRHNLNSIGVCYVGGIGLDGKPKDTLTDAQKHAFKSAYRTTTRQVPTSNNTRTL